jgi:acyl carrier protein
MTTDQIHSKLATIIADKVDSHIAPEQVTLDSRLREDLGIDSLSVAEMLYEIEEVFGATLEVADPHTLLTVRDAVNAIALELRLPVAN